MVNLSISWDVNTQKGIMRGQSLRFTQVFNPINQFHTCYEIICSGTHCPPGSESTVYKCYPVIIITGLPKCGTSAMYNLLSRFPDVILMQEKENCPYAHRRTHWGFMASMPDMKSLGPNSLIIDGCIDVVQNMRFRNIILKEAPPSTYYIVMIRDYADMLWSSYNFWCKLGFDKSDCDSTKWVNPKVHIRSPENFHDIILGDSNGKELLHPFYYPMHKPCINGGGYYTEYINFYLYNNNLKNHTIIIASEELESNPYKIANNIANIFNMNISNIDLGIFKSIRINSQDHKGGTNSVPIQMYKPGVYSISHYRLMFNKTRELINKCWYDDCIAIGKLSNYYYSACYNESNKPNKSNDNINFIHFKPSQIMIHNNNNINRSETYHKLLQNNHYNNQNNHNNIPRKILNSQSWEISNQKGLMKGQLLRFQEINPPKSHDYLSCYEAQCEGKHCSSNKAIKNNNTTNSNKLVTVIRFCFPAIIVTGYIQTGTPVIYDILSKFPNVKTIQNTDQINPYQDNCPFAIRRLHWSYLNTFPSLAEIEENDIYLDRCSDISSLLDMKNRVLKGAFSYFVVMIRNFPDMLWSTYNMYCKLFMDPDCPKVTLEINPDKHNRSFNSFHEIVSLDTIHNYSQYNTLPNHK
eukprot:gene11751-15724_t